MKLLITGASGFVGRVLLDQLCKEQKDIFDEYILIQNKTPIPLQSITELKKLGKVRILEANLIEPWNSIGKADVVFNLAADGSRDPYSSDSSQFFLKINENLISWSQNSEVKKIVHVSSGICDYFDQDRTAPILKSEKKIGFARIRKQVETNLEEISSQEAIDVKILRLYTFVGKQLMKMDNYAVTNFIKSAKQLGKIRISGNSETKRTYLSQKDLAAVLVDALSNSAFPRRISIASQEVVTMKNLAEFITRRIPATIEYRGQHEEVQDYIPIHAQTILPDLTRVIETWSDTITGLLSEDGWE